jgi:hypothetical protein
MASNSLASILEKMKDRSITERWGAVCAFDRERLNRVLLQQWLEKYDGSNYVPVFSGEMHLNDSKTERGVLKDVLLGKPLLSFEPAALDNSRAILTLSILGGSFTAHEIKTGVMYSYEITEAQGYTLKIKLDLSLVVGEIDRLGRVTLDLSKGTEFACNLAGPVPSQQKIGEFFHEKFNKLPPERQVYELGVLDLKGGGDLTPTNFILLTQRAPGADQPGALNFDDGAVVVLIKLRGNAMGGDIPSKDRFPYLIPDDEENGVRKYSATMVLAQEFVSRSDDEKLDLIRSVLFPGEKNVFVEHLRETPRDMVIFGSLDPSRTSLTIEPAAHSLKAGGSPLSYKAFFNNAPVSGVTWSVKSLNTIESAGSISTSGVYQPVSAAKIGKQSVRNIVTATWTEPANGDKPARLHRVSALLLVTAEAMTVSPACVPRQVGGARVTFVATALSGSTLTWSQPAYGTLVATGNTAIYTPPTNADDLPEHLMVQPIEVRDQSGESVQACVVLSKFPPTMTIEPAFVSSIGRSTTVELETITDAPPEFERRWEVLGDGTVQNGIFTAPTSSARPYSVVKCDIYYPGGGILVRSGYSIIKLKNFDEEPGWNKLTKFALTALRSPKVYANGYQQLAIEAHIETDGLPLTPEEEDTLMIYHRRSRQRVAELVPGQEGIPYDPLTPVLWAQTRVPNRFRQYLGNLQNETTSAPAAGTPNKITVYLVCRDTQVTEFYASVEDPNGLPLDSDVYPGHEDGTIKLEPVPSPETHPQDFKFTRRRIVGGGPEDPENGEEDEGFDMYLETTDYWDLTYKKGGQVGGTALSFEAVEFQTLDIAASGKLSIVKWESPFENEKMFTYTGYAFNDPRVAGDQNVMVYDSKIKENAKLKPVLEHKLASDIAQGRFLIGVFRRIDIRQADWNGDPGNPDLYPLKEPLKVILTDTEGHRHPVRISFPANNRNRPSVEPLFEN